MPSNNLQTGKGMFRHNRIGWLAHCTQRGPAARLRRAFALDSVKGSLPQSQIAAAGPPARQRIAPSRMTRCAEDSAVGEKGSFCAS